jgi:hypothetical protein
VKATLVYLGFRRAYAGRNLNRKPEVFVQDVQRDRYLELVLKDAIRQRAREVLGTPTKSRVWAFLNSAFGLFLFSSVLLGSLSFAYGQFGRHLDRRHSADQLELEISLRLRDLKKLTTGPDANRYSRIVNVSRVNDGDASRFYLRKPVFSEYEKKRTVSLLMQLSLLVYGGERRAVLETIRDLLRADDLIVRIRNDAPQDTPDRAKGKTEQEEDQLADKDDQLKKDYGQAELFQHIDRLSRIPLWRGSEY